MIIIYFRYIKAMVDDDDSTTDDDDQLDVGDSLFCFFFQLFIFLIDS